MAKKKKDEDLKSIKEWRKVLQFTPNMADEIMRWYIAYDGDREKIEEATRNHIYDTYSLPKTREADALVTAFCLITEEADKIAAEAEDEIKTEEDKCKVFMQAKNELNPKELQELQKYGIGTVAKINQIFSNAAFKIAYAPEAVVLALARCGKFIIDSPHHLRNACAWFAHASWQNLRGIKNRVVSKICGIMQDKALASEDRGEIDHTGKIVTSMYMSNALIDIETAMNILDEKIKKTPESEIDKIENLNEQKERFLLLAKSISTYQSGNLDEALKIIGTDSEKLKDGLIKENYTKKDSDRFLKNYMDNIVRRTEVLCQQIFKGEEYDFKKANKFIMDNDENWSSQIHSADAYAEKTAKVNSEWKKDFGFIDGFIKSETTKVAEEWDKHQESANRFSFNSFQHNKTKAEAKDKYKGDDKTADESGKEGGYTAGS